MNILVSIYILSFCIHLVSCEIMNCEFKSQYKSNCHYFNSNKTAIVSYSKSHIFPKVVASAFFKTSLDVLKPGSCSKNVNKAINQACKQALDTSYRFNRVKVESSFDCGDNYTIGSATIYLPCVCAFNHPSILLTQSAFDILFASAFMLERPAPSISYCPSQTKNNIACKNICKDDNAMAMWTTLSRKAQIKNKKNATLLNMSTAKSRNDNANMSSSTSSSIKAATASLMSNGPDEEKETINTTVGTESSSTSMTTKLVASRSEVSAAKPKMCIMVLGLFIATIFCFFYL